MQPPRYAELHCHTNFSFLDGASHPETLVARAAELEYEALAVTDHDGFYGVVKSHVAAQAIGMPIVYGTEVGMPRHPDPAPSVEAAIPGPVDHPETDIWAPQGDPTRRGRIRRMHGSKPTDVAPTDHLVLLAPSPGGYVAVSRLITKAQFRGEKDRPLYAYAELDEASRSGRLVALTGCAHGAVARAAARADVATATREASRLRELFPGRLYVELWDHGLPEDDLRNDVLADVAIRLGLPTVATNNVHHAYRSEAELAEVLAAIGGRRSLDVADGFRPATDERYLRDRADIARLFARYPGAVGRAAELGRELAFDLDLLTPRLPDFPMPGPFTDEIEYLEHLVLEGARDVYPDGAGGIDPVAVARLRHELEVIEQLGFAGFFLVAWDIVSFARSQDIYCQIRGSGADSAVCRCIGLTRVDPIRLSLPFERFLSEERGRPPDIDIDFEAERREEVIQYCYRRYGRERAAMVANVITYRARSVLQDVGKAFGLTQAQVNGLTKYVDTRDPQALAGLVDLPAGFTADRIYEMCHRLDGFPRHLGIHSGGMVIAQRPLWEVVPVEWGRMEDRSVVQWDKDDCAAMGVVKFDLLALGALNGLHITVDMIRDLHGVDIDLARIPQEPVVYPHPSTEPILEKTLGVPVFQEQLMELARICAGFTPGQSDRLRAAMSSKRSQEAMDRLEDEVYAGMAGNGIVGEAADEIWEKLQGFASFGFPESHSVSFAYIVYAGAWLKYHWPAEFFAGLLNAQPMGFYTPNSLVQDAVHHGVLIRPPDINESAFDCTIEPATADPDDIVEFLDGRYRRGRGPAEDPLRLAVAVRIGLRYVRNLGDADIARIEAARMVAGPFTSVEDVAQRTGLRVDALEGLAAAGAMASLGVGRRDGMWAAGPLSGLGPDRLALAEGVGAPELPDMSRFQEMQADLWSTGISVTHPVAFVRDRFDAEGCLTIADALSLRTHGAKARVGGIITHRQRPGTAKGVRFLNLEDETGLLNVIVMPQVWDANWEIARKAVGVVIEGRLEFQDGVTNLVAHRFAEWSVGDGTSIPSRDFR